MTFAILCSAVLGALIFVLGFNVTRMRGVTAKTGGSQMPTDPADRLLIAIRAHGNAAEYIPTLMVLMLLLAWREPAAWTAVLIGGATASRLAHAFGMLTAKSLAAESMIRVAGAIGTYIFGVALAGAVLITLL